MPSPELRSVPMQDSGASKSKTTQQKEQSEDFSKLLAIHQTAFENKGFNLFGDRKMLEAVYGHFLNDYSGDVTLDVSAIAEETDESEPKVVLALEVFKSILGSPDYTPPAGGASVNPEAEEDAEERKAA